MPTTWVVNTTADSGSGSLRAAITGAASGDTITFDPSLDGTTITLSSGILAIATNLTITGPGANQLTINANATSAVMSIAAEDTVTISGLTIEGGSASQGGNISNAGTLTLNDDAINGGSAVISGGGLYSTGTATVENCSFTANAGIRSYTLGGAVYNGGTMTLSNSTFYGNSASGDGGALSVGTPNTTVITGCTIYDNTCAANGGNINGGTIAYMADTIVAGGVGTDPDIRATITAGNNNIIGNSTGLQGGIANNSNGNQVGTAASPINPLLGTFQVNSGTTSTMIPQTGSPAIRAAGAITTVADPANSSATTITVANAVAVASAPPGQVFIVIDGEEMAVTAVNLTNNTLTVTRDISGVPANLNTGDSVYLFTDQVGNDRPTAGDIGAYEVTPPVASLVFVAQPMNTTAGAVLAPVTVAASSSTGLSVAGAVITIAISQGTLSGTLTATTNASGIATFGNLSDDTAGTYTLTATTLGVSGVSSNSFVISGATAAKLIFETQPSSTTAGATLNAVSVLAEDQYGNPSGNEPVSMASSASTLNGTLTETTNASGIATFGDLSVDLVGTYTLTAGAAGVSSISSNQFIISAGQAAALRWTVQPMNTVAGASINAPGAAPEVSAVDHYGNLVSGVSIHLTLSAGGTLNGTATEATSGAGAVFSGLSIDQAGTYTLTASTSGLAGVASNPFDITGASASALAFVTQPSSTTAGATINAVSVEAEDTFGNPVANVAVSIAINPGALSSGAAPLTTNAAGLVVFTNLSEDLVGVYSLVASAAGMQNATSNVFTISAAAPAKLAYLSQPSSTTAGTVLNTVTVQVSDAFNNPVPNAVVALAITPGTLSAGTTPLTSNAAGQVLFANLAEDTVGTYTLVASTTNVSGAASNAFTISAGAANALSFVSQPNSTTAGTVLNPITLQVTDKYNNAVAGTAVSLGISTGSLSSGTPQLTSNAAGQAVFSNLSEDIAGTYSLIGSITGANATSNAFVISAAAAAKLLFTTQPSSTTAGTMLNSVTVQAEDQYNNIVSGLAISISIAPGSLSTGTTPLTSNAAGQAAFSNLSEDKAGTYSLIASATNLANAVSNPFTISSASAAMLAFLSQPNNTSAGTYLNPITVQVTDQYDNAVPNISVGIALAAGTLSTGTTPLITNGAGQAIFSDLSEDMVGTYALKVSSQGLTTITSNAFVISAAAAGKIAFLTQPSTIALGATLNAITVQAVDGYGNAVADGTISMLISAPGSLKGSTTAVTNNMGEAVFTTLQPGVGGLFTLEATAGQASAVSNPFAVTASTDKLTFVTEPSSTSAGKTLNPVTVKLTDPAGDLLPGVVISISLPATSLSGATSGTTNAAGQVTFNTLAVDAAGTYTLLAASSGVSDVNSALFTITASTPAKFQFLSQPSNTTAGVLINAITVKVVDQYGNVVSNAGVTMTPSTGKFTSTSTTLVSTSAAGLAVFSNLAETVAGTCSLEAAVTGVGTISSNPFSVAPAAPAVVTFLTQPTSTTAGSSLGQITVKVTDAYGNLAASTPVSLFISINTVNGTTTATTNTQGIAVFSNLDITTTGTYTLSAGVGTLPRKASASFTIKPGPGILSYVTEPSSTTSGSTLSPVTVKLVDQYGNPITGTAVTITLPGGTLSGTTVLVTNASGEVTFSTLSIAKEGTGYTLLVSAVGVASESSNSFSIT